MNLEGLLEVIPMALEGWFGVFAVIEVIVVTVMILNKICK